MQARDLKWGNETQEEATRGGILEPASDQIAYVLPEYLLATAFFLFGFLFVFAERPSDARQWGVNLSASAEPLADYK